MTEFTPQEREKYNKLGPTTTQLAVTAIVVLACYLAFLWIISP